MTQLIRKHPRLFSAATLLGAILALAVICIMPQSALALDESDLDGDWLLTALTINGSAEGLPDGELRFEVSSSAGTVRRYWVLHDLSMPEGDETVSAAFRGPSEWSSTDISEMQAVGLAPSQQSGIVEMEVAAGITGRIAYRMVDLGGGHTRAILTRTYQQGAWVVPSATVYAPRPAGQGQGAVMYQSPSGGRVLTSLTLEK